MAFRLDPAERVGEEVRRCAREEVDRALDQLSAGIERDPASAIHEARKSLKKLRALVRLCRGAMPGSARRREGAGFRDAGRRLASAREADAMIAALDCLAQHADGQVAGETFAQLRARFVQTRGPAHAGRAGVDDAAAAVREQLELARVRIESWPLREEGFAALRAGLGRSYARGRSARRRARRDAEAEALHEWRKRVKDLWYHVRLLEPTWPQTFEANARELHRLSDLLGDDHDLSVLAGALREEPRRDVVPVLALIEQRQAQLRTDALLLGERVYAEKPKAFLRRMRGCWRAAAREAAASGEPGVHKAFTPSQRTALASNGERTRGG